MATISNTPRPGYVWDATDNVWYPIGVGAHQHTNAADTPAVMPYSTYAAAGKNKLINGDFAINQRGFTTLTSPSNGTYIFDRWETEQTNITTTFSSQTFTTGTAPVSGYEATNFVRLVTTSAGASSYSLIGQRIEDARSFAGQTITVSLWAKAGTGTPKIAIRVNQNFGSGGSAGTALNASATTISTSWTRYSFAINVPSVSGKTIGAGSFLQISVLVDDDLVGSGVGIQNNTFDLWGVQAEAGSTVTAFQTATGNPASELAACQRYYQVFNRNGMVTIGSANSTSSFFATFQFVQTMRAAPTLTLATAGQTTGTVSFLISTAGYPSTTGTHNTDGITVSGFQLGGAGYSTQWTAGQASFFYANGSTNIYTASAEL